MSLDDAVTILEPLEPGTVLVERYRVVRHIGGGGMALVYLVEDMQPPPGRVWAMKELRPNPNALDRLPEARSQFQHEARLLRTLEHPGLPKVIDDFEAHGRSCLVMEYVDGTTLHGELSRAQDAHHIGLPEAKVLDWSIQICRVLEYLHGQPEPVIFRDIKPSNVMLTPDGQVKLIDFGIARTFKGGQAHDTRVMGTENYAPPEQWGSGQTDPRSDVYALGATMYHLLAGELPPMYFLSQAPPSIRQSNPLVSPATDAVVGRATSRHPVERFASAAAMRTALEAALATLSQVSSSNPAENRLACPRCGRPNRSAARFCGWCGHLLRGTMRATLSMMDQTGQFSEIKLSGSPFLIGRRSVGDGIYPDLDLSEHDARFVSRRHALIVPTPDGPALVDVSHNGTRLNGQRLIANTPYPLRNGDRLQVGRVELAFHVIPGEGAQDG